MSGSQEGGTLNTSDRQEMPIAFPDQASEQRLRKSLAGSTGGALSVRITEAQPADVEGHALDLSSVWVRLQLEGDDTEGHAIRVQFPTAADADKFRRSVLMAGILAGSVVLGSAGAIALRSNAPAQDLSSPVNQSQYMAPAQQEFDIATGINPATGMPWRSGFQERSDGELSGAGNAAADADAAGPATVRHPAGTVGGPLEGNE